MFAYNNINFNDKGGEMTKLIFGAMYNDKEAELEAGSLYQAKLKAIELFKPPKSKEHMVIVALLRKDDVEVIHPTLD